jgi:hypothetical protein
MDDDHSNIELRLPKDEALVLFDWLSRFNQGNSNSTDEVEKQILANLEAIFEKLLVEYFTKKNRKVI